MTPDSVAHSLIGNIEAQGFWLDDPEHRAALKANAGRQLAFFERSKSHGAGFSNLDWSGSSVPSAPQELFSTARMVHSYALAKAMGLHDSADDMIDHGMDSLWTQHRDLTHGGYISALRDGEIVDDRKLTYAHVFVLLAGSSAKQAGHRDADRLIADASEVLEKHFWDSAVGLFADEFTQDWQPFSTYRGMNANMHGTEALLGAFEATGDRVYLEQAGRILDFFLQSTASKYDHRIPEHYNSDWEVDVNYSGDPMFRPAGTTPGHSFEWARLGLQYWDLCGCPENENWPDVARKLTQRALVDAWDSEKGGIAYTLKFDGTPDITNRYWWPVTEAIGVMAALIKLERRPEDERWYRQLWQFAQGAFIDVKQGGWFPEIDDQGRPSQSQFIGKPDIYHALQAELLPLSVGISRAFQPLTT